MSVQTSTLKVSLITGRSNGWLTTNFETAGGKGPIAQRLVDYVQRILSGNESAYGTAQPPSIALSIEGNAVRASGTLIFNTVIATDAFVVNDVTFTAVASGATGNQFNVGASDTETAVNAAAAINASVTALVSGYVTASGAAGLTTTGVVTVYSTNYGIYGNQITLVSNDSTITASGARLAGGLADATAQTLSF